MAKRPGARIRHAPKSAHRGAPVAKGLQSESEHARGVPGLSQKERDMTANHKLRRAMDIARTVRAMRSDDLLATVGLERRRSLLEQLGPALGAFTAGVAVGAGIGVLLAPSSGDELRQQLLDRANRMSDRITQNVNRRVEARTNGGREEEALETERRTHA
jgi:hypothetical protein